ncbi:MAG: hypothetical protein K5907_01875 [Treponema sp.]|nr:hypothetical protein [Treponema sp.]
MRLSTMLVMLTFLGLVYVSLYSLSYYSRTIGEKEECLRNSYNAKKFIAESFKQTCDGSGFRDFEEWQLTCKSLFKLEYIAWCEAEDFMIDENYDGNNNLMYGTWIGQGLTKDCSGEVFYRKNRRSVE